MVMPWLHAARDAVVIERESRIFGGKELRGTRAQIAARYDLTGLLMPIPGVNAEFKYTGKGRLPSDIDLAKFVLEAEAAGYAVSASQLATTQRMVVADGDNVVVHVSASYTPPLRPVPGAVQAADVTVSHITTIDTKLEGIINKAALLYGLNKAATP